MSTSDKRPISDVSGEVAGMSHAAPTTEDLQTWARENVRLYGPRKAAAEMGLTLPTTLRLAAGAHVRTITRQAATAAYAARVQHGTGRPGGVP
jgi:hypothetical protein